MQYSEALCFIHSLGKFSKPAGLDRITAVMNKLCNPQNAFRSVHIAGTNGKGSVSAMTAEIFKTAGLRTGLFISPFVIDFRERIQINGNFISVDDLVFYAQRVAETGIELTEFEFITALAFLYFRDRKCDVVVAETGLGGRFDATNVLDSELTVITKIGMDHAAILGDTVEKIAAEKCGIIKESPVTVTSHAQRPEALAVIMRAANRLVVPDISCLAGVKSDESGNRFCYRGRAYRTSLCGEYQIENALIAIEAAANSRFNISDETIEKALVHTFFPARMEVIRHNPPVLLDGAHNPDGAAALAQALKKYRGRVTAIVGVMRDKEYKKVFAEVLPLCKAAIAVTVAGMPRSLLAECTADAAREFCPAVAAESYDAAIRLAAETAGENPIVVFGSLYLAGGIREPLKNFFK